MVKITKIGPSDSAVRTRKRVAAYCRVSTDSAEQLDSLEAQKEHYWQVISANHDWEDAGIFYDEGISGTRAETREGFIDLLDSCRAGKVDMVITKSISRFAMKHFVKYFF